MLVELGFPPGFRRGPTEYASKGFWYTGNLVNWRNGVGPLPEKGWRTFSTTAMLGKGRAMIAWKASALSKLAAIGTSSHLYAMSGSGVLSNITPARATGTLANDPFAVVDTQTLVTVTHTSHGLTTGDYVFYSGASAGGGITIAGQYVVTVLNGNSYTIVHSAPATSTDATTGGASVAYIYNISPGLADSASTGGYGYGLYGAGTYGTPRVGYGITTDARVWTLDTFGQYLIAAPGQWGDIYEWQLNTSTRAAKITNSPTALAVVVTDEAFVMALGAGGNPRNVAWCDQGVNTTWTPAATNQAGDKDLQTFGKIMCGRKVKGGTLVFTDTDVHKFTYVGGANIFDIERAGDGCGIIAPGASASSNTITVWMGNNSLWIYDGYVRTLDCPIADDIFNDLNALQKAKVTCRYDSAFGEFTWYFPSAGSTENDRYLRWHPREGLDVFTSGPAGGESRLSGTDRGTYLLPMAVGNNGYVYEHEVGGVSDAFIESAPLEWPNELGSGGDRLVVIDDYWPDEKTAGDVTISFLTKMAPNGAETTYGPYTAANPRNLRITARQVKVRFDAANMNDFRIGANRINVKRGSGR